MDSALAFAWFHWNLMRQPYPLPETLIGNSARTYFDFLMERWCATPGAVTPEAYAEYARCFCTPDGVRATCADYRAIELDLRRRGSRPQAHLPNACPVGSEHNKASGLADGEQA